MGKQGKTGWIVMGSLAAAAALWAPAASAQQRVYVQSAPQVVVVPAPQRVWVPAHWERRGHSQVWVQGYWAQPVAQAQPRDWRVARADRIDRDRDGIPDRHDRDRDGDGVPNFRDRYPDNPWRH
ncbi:YXWGXW repeat-containing protein [Ramlibacter humi]|uniref:BcpO-related WXXGXW repeat protein n=1 Tax=Ramlibacter humi TaxID=2530451 RepID=A0A4Z0CBN7_9BURK|nr:YXWGXW repeat-containing protein [Ramlibacter humi]TFZ07780.1 hypothetical protein EZ216_01040 [Ramlibacter humi]